MSELIEVSGLANDESCEPKPKSRLLRLNIPAKIIIDQPKASEPLTDNALDVAASSVRLATAAARHSWNKVLVRPK